MPNAKPLPPQCYGDEMCMGYYITVDARKEFRTQSDFDNAMNKAQGLIQLVVFSYNTFDGGSGMTLRDRLVYLVARDQVTRYLIAYSQNKTASSLPDLTRGLAGGIIVLLMTRGDAEEVAVLKELWKKEGWPLKSKAGKEASTAAWLAVQHADNDPAFQAKALAFFGQHLSDGEINRNEYPLLYDRVHLRTVGTQRFGTQMTCKVGKWASDALESKVHVDEWRKDFGLKDLAAYTRDIETMYGAKCPLDK